MNLPNDPSDAVKRRNPHLFRVQFPELFLDSVHPVPADADETSEAALQDAIVKFCKHKGWICNYSPMCFRTRRQIGEQDFTIRADGGRVFFIECKTAKGKLTSEQLGLALWAEKLGHKIHLVRSVAEFLKVVR